ncbi:SBBP repeat-containing protein [Rhodopirellula bahusiensis]|uniref:SBBP repeat-containing protein n=1 Tax=Rhodopirellula bahusiensis TaxID=2014065 RepID=UPI001E39015B|nr:SBBP repeat-containing protein [Rhodopirellula bahusiensis]
MIRLLLSPSPRFLCVVVLCFVAGGPRWVLADNYELAFSTFLGGSDWEHARDVCADSEGNVYIVGGTVSTDFPTTEGTFLRVHDRSGARIDSAGHCDAFVCKFDRDGALVWSTLLGGPNYDRAYAVEVDSEGSVFIAGRAGPEFPVTEDAFQTEFQGSKQSIYGMQNGFITKLSPDGSTLQWSSYVGANQLCRDLAIDEEGSVYLPLCYTGVGPTPPSEWFANAYRKQPIGGADVGAIKVSGDGKNVIWATWMGGSGDEVGNCGLRLDRDSNVFLNFTTNSTDVPTTSQARQRTYGGGADSFIAKLSPNGENLLYGTYFGSTGNEEGNSTHSMAVDSRGNAYLAVSTTSKDLPVTEGVVQSKFAGGDRDMVIAKFSTQGALLQCTYLGGTDNEGPDGVYADERGNVFFTGNVKSADFPVTDDALQPVQSNPSDAIAVVLSDDFSHLEFSSYLGGESYDDGRSCFLDEAGNLYITGSTNGPGWPMKSAHQATFAGGGGGKELCYKGGCFAGDVILAKIAFTK